MTSDQVPDIMQRARRLARRLLAGSGSAAVTAYRIDPSAPAAYVAHAMRADGRILVAACPPEGTPLAIAPDDVAVDVRLDVTLDAAEPGVRITAATAHLLGDLTWVDGEDRALVLASSRTPACHCAIVGDDPLERVREIAAGPGGRLGVISCERVMLHCVSGVSSHDIEEILDIDSADDAAAAPSASWSPQEIMDAHEAVSAVGQLGLRAVCEAVREGQMPGWICSSRPAVGVCPTLWDRTLCVDVDAHGVTLMSITGEEVTTLVVSFGQALADAGEVGPALEQLASHALPQRLTRP